MRARFAFPAACFRAPERLLDWLNQKRAPSSEESLTMSITIRPYKRGGWEVDIRVVSPDGRGTLASGRRSDVVPIRRPPLG
jgi:hypothetical protein